MKRLALVVLVLAAVCGVAVTGALAAEQQTQTKQQTQTQTQEQTQTQTKQQTQTQTQAQTQEKTQQQNCYCDCPFCGGLECECPFCDCAQNCYQWGEPLDPFEWMYQWGWFD